MDTVLRQLPAAAYWRLKEQGFKPGGIVDVGAHEGEWTKNIRKIFSECPVHMIDAREEQEQALRQLSQKGAIEYSIALLGSRQQDSVEFLASGTGSSLFAERSNAKRSVRLLPMRTLDSIIANSAILREPYFLKLDVQGGELECLGGGELTLRRSEVVQLETGLLEYNLGAPLAPQVISFMDAHGFAMFDIAGFVRPNGINLVQVDFLFVKNGSALRPNFFNFKDI